MAALALRFAIAMGIGLLIGTERERRKGRGLFRSSAGIRTFSPSVGVSCKVGFVYLFRLAFCASSVARAEVGLPEIKQPQDDLWTNCNLDHTFTPFTEQFIGFGDPFQRERVGD